jgi:hypothetical protein
MRNDPLGNLLSRRASGAAPRLDLGHQPIPPLRDRLDILRRLRIVPECLPQLEHGPRERVIADDEPGPERREQSLARHDLAAFGREQEQEVHDLGLDARGAGRGPELAAVAVRAPRADDELGSR